jgi:DNA-directed RNA polymerase subunit L
MELKTIKKTTKELELEIIGETETLLNPITDVLLDNDDVDYASYMCDHPELKRRRLFIRVKKGNPEEILKKAVKQLEEEMKSFGKDIETQSKSKK